MPSRKHRRRPKNLLSEYNRRQRNHVWLETHIWHAKRFKMCDKWGYRLPVQPTNKSYRAAYRSTQHYCLLQDVSYYCCIQIEGPESLVLEALSNLTSTETGPTFSSKGCLRGCREGKLMLFAYKKYPLEAICPATFLWQPAACEQLETSGQSCRKLWIWIHPSSYEECWENLSLSFKKVRSTSDDNEGIWSAEASSKQNIISGGDVDNTANDSTKTIPSQEEKIGSVTLLSLKDCLVRFKLTGPLALKVLGKVLSPSETLTEELGERKWWNTFFASNNNIDALNLQKMFWKEANECSSPGELHPHMVLGLTVRDPRYTIPQSREKCKPDEFPSSYDCGKLKETLPVNLCNSPIWDSVVRQQVKDGKCTDIQINDQRSKLLVPGCPMPERKDEMKIPVLIIQNPGVRTKWLQSSVKGGFYGSGLDLILPAGWSMPFWVALTYCGARVGGLQEMDTMSMDCGTLRAMDHVDTPASAIYEKELADELWEIYCRKPPAKRHNFITLGVKYPFENPWNLLVHEWNTAFRNSDLFSGSDFTSQESICELKSNSECLSTTISFYLLRNQHTLQILENVVSSGKLLTKALSGLLSDETKLAKCSSLVNICKDLTHCIVAVRVYMVNRGHPEQFAKICIPQQEDYAKLSKNINHPGPLERKHPNVRKSQTRDNDKKVSSKLSREEVVSATKSLLDGNDRRVIGFINQGGFTQSLGQGSGVGYCSFVGLLHAITLSPSSLKCLVLVRNTSTHQYRFAHLQILTDLS